MAKTASIGALLKMDNGATYDTIGLVKSISGVEQTMDLIDATHLASASYYKEYLAGYLDGGEVQIEAQLDPEAADASNQLLVEAEFTGRTSETFRIVLPTGPYIQFDAFVTSWHPFQVPENDVVGLSFTLKITGAPTTADAES